MLEAPVMVSKMNKVSKKTHILSARFFVRWLDHDFEPEARTIKRR